MDVLKASIYIFFVMLSISAVSGMLPYIGITPPVDYSISTKDYASDVVDSFGWSDNPFYDIGTGLLSFWLVAVPVIESFPAMLAAYGAPTWIYVPLHGIWRVMWLTALAIGIIAGRQT